MQVARDMARTTWPAPSDKDGPLPPLLVALTLTTGLVDAVSYLALGHVFVANMTGNIVFLGFAIAGAKGLSITASLAALAAFLVGAFAGGRLGASSSAHRGRLLRNAVFVELVAVGGAVAVAAADPGAVSGAVRYTLIGLLAVAMGVQNSSARRLGVADLTTTVLTLTLVGVAADSRAAGGPGSKLGRRAVAVGAMLTGALVGGVLVLRVSLAAPLAVALGVLLVTLLAAQALSRSKAGWASPAP
jgi:uncharacterized membrane protein YoaK (UPF0700 family)